MGGLISKPKAPAPPPPPPPPPVKSEAPPVKSEAPSIEKSDSGTDKRTNVDVVRRKGPGKRVAPLLSDSSKTSILGD